MTTRKNDGRQLEQLVRFIEGGFAQDFKVETRKPVYDGSGTQIAELDILITGKVGTADFTSLIECRARPSDGPAPVGWIEQLAGRRTRLKLNRVMAVSSTGFSQPARDAAHEFGIPLREFAQLTYNDVADWLPANAPLTIRYGEIINVRVFPTPTEGETGDLLGRIPFSIDDLCLVHRQTGNRESIRQLWRKVLNENNHQFNGLQPGGPEKQVSVTAKPELLQQYDFELGDIHSRIEAVEFDAAFRIVVPDMPLIHAADYVSAPSDPNSKQKLVTLANWKGSENDIIKEMMIFAVPKQQADTDAS